MTELPNTAKEDRPAFPKEKTPEAFAYYGEKAKDVKNESPNHLKGAFALPEPEPAEAPEIALNATDPEINMRQSEHQQEIRTKAFNYGVDEDKDPTDAGLMETAESLARESHENSKTDQEKQKEKKFKELLHLLDQLEAQNIEMQKQIDENIVQIKEYEEEIKANNAALKAIDKLQELRDAGKFDQENPDHLALLEKAGITLEEYLENPSILEDREKFFLGDNGRLQELIDRLNAQNIVLGSKINSNNNTIKTTRAEIDSGTMSLEEATAAQEHIDSIRQENNSLKEEELKTQAHIGVENRDTYVSFSNEAHSTINSADEVEEFMKEFAKAQKIENNLDRLLREKQLLEELSDDTKELISWEPEAEKLFASNYFDALNNLDNTSNELAQTATQKLPFTPS